LQWRRASDTKLKADAPHWNLRLPTSPPAVNGTKVPYAAAASTTIVRLHPRKKTYAKRLEVAKLAATAIDYPALVLGKAVLIADMLPLINRFPSKPLIYNIAWKTVIYLLISAVLHYLERLIDFWRETRSFIAGNEKLLSVIIWPHFFAIQIIFFILIAMYCTVHELVRVIGREKAMRIFFGPMSAPEVVNNP
jgi:hypothetical protein